MILPEFIPSIPMRHLPIDGVVLPLRPAAVQTPHDTVYGTWLVDCRVTLTSPRPLSPRKGVRSCVHEKACSTFAGAYVWFLLNCVIYPLSSHVSLTRFITASDGGYTLLGLPPAAGRGTFEGVKWSDALTCKSQTCALASSGVSTRVGGTYHDVDEADDVAGLEKRSPRGLAEVR